MIRRTALALLLGFVSVDAANAQILPIDPNSRQPEVTTENEGLREVGRTADAGAGEIGQRQTQEEAAPNIEPLGRINNRIENRLQNRLRNRIDRNYDPTANATAPFERAEDQTRKTEAREPRR